MKRLNKNENGITGWSILAIILIILIIWQFTGNYLGIGTPLDLINPDPKVITDSAYIKDIVDLSITDLNRNSYAELILDSGHLYTFYFNTNAPYKLGDKYRFTIELRFTDTPTDPVEDWITIQTETHLISFSALWTNIFTTPLTMNNTDMNYKLFVNFYSPTGAKISDYICSIRNANWPNP